MQMVVITHMLSFSSRNPFLPYIYIVETGCYAAPADRDAGRSGFDGGYTQSNFKLVQCVHIIYGLEGENMPSVLQALINRASAWQGKVLAVIYCYFLIHGLSQASEALRHLFSFTLILLTWYICIN